MLACLSPWPVERILKTIENKQGYTYIDGSRGVDS